MKGIKICTNCGLPKMLIQHDREELQFNNDNVCIYCQDHKKFSHAYDINYSEKQKKFEELLEKYKGKGEYDVVVFFTGGKDSAYSAYKLAKEYNLKVLALTWNNGFFSPEHIQNIKNLVKNLGIDHKFISLDRDILGDYYKSRLMNTGRFCGCYPPSMLFLSPDILKIGACILVISANFGQAMSRLQNQLMFTTPNSSTAKAIKIAVDNTGFIPLKSEQFYLSIIFDIIVGQFKKKSINYISKCMEDFNILCKQDKYLVNLPQIFNWDLQLIYEKISQYGWKKPQEATAMGHTSCTMESMKGYIAFYQNVLTLDIYELSTERRFGRITKKQFEEGFPALGYTDKEPKTIDLLLSVIGLTKEQFYSILNKKIMAKKTAPEINIETVKRIPINIPIDVLKEKAREFYKSAVLG